MAIMITLRSAQLTDARDLLTWKNDAETRRYSLVTPHEIEWDLHIEWLTRRLANTAAYTYIIEYECMPVGTVRVDPILDDPILDYASLEVAIVVAPEARGRGVARQALQLISMLWPSRGLVARIVPENIPSLRVFIRSGYLPMVYVVSPRPHLILQKRRTGCSFS